MLINRNNYESFFLDFIEGRLNAEEEAGLMAFLAENPELKLELDQFENIHLLPEPAFFNGKDKLKKNLAHFSEINEENFDQYCVAKMEGDLDETLSKSFDNYLSEHPERLKDYKLLLQTFLEPDKTIVFEEKQKLRHRHIVANKNRILSLVSIAASIALIIVSYQFYNNYRTQDKKIYTAIHEKLKIDSLLTANILGPVNKEPVTTAVKENKRKSIAKIENKDTIIIRHTEFKTRKPIEIVQLDAGKELDQIMPIAHRSDIMLAPIENKEALLNVKEYASRELKKRLDIEDINIDENMTFWKAAQTGVKQLNKLTGANIKMDKKYDTISNRTKVIIHTNLLSFYTSTKK
jgi:hypothetical protein